jgi:hypothetical protein
METVELPDDARLLDPSLCHYLPNAGCVSSIIESPALYGPFVRKFKVIDPLIFSTLDSADTPLLQFGDGVASDLGSSHGTPTPSRFPPFPAQRLFEILSECPNIDEFIWTSVSPPPDGICEVRTFGSHCAVLRDLLSLCRFSPRTTPD